MRSTKPTTVRLNGSDVIITPSTTDRFQWVEVVEKSSGKVIVPLQAVKMPRVSVGTHITVPANKLWRTEAFKPGEYVIKVSTSATKPLFGFWERSNSTDAEIVLTQAEADNANQTIKEDKLASGKFLLWILIIVGILGVVLWGAFTLWTFQKSEQSIPSGMEDSVQTERGDIAFGNQSELHALRKEIAELKETWRKASNGISDVPPPSSARGEDGTNTTNVVDKVEEGTSVTKVAKSPEIDARFEARVIRDIGNNNQFGGYQDHSVNFIVQKYDGGWAPEWAPKYMAVISADQKSGSVIRVPVRDGVTQLKYADNLVLKPLGLDPGVRLAYGDDDMGLEYSRHEPAYQKPVGWTGAPQLRVKTKSPAVDVKAPFLRIKIWHRDEKEPVGHSPTDETPQVFELP